MLVAPFILIKLESEPLFLSAGELAAALACSEPNEAAQFYWFARGPEVIEWGRVGSFHRKRDVASNLCHHLRAYSSSTQPTTVRAHSLSFWPSPSLQLHSLNQSCPVECLLRLDPQPFPLPPFHCLSSHPDTASLVEARLARESRQRRQIPKDGLCCV